MKHSLNFNLNPFPALHTNMLILREIDFKDTDCFFIIRCNHSIKIKIIDEITFLALHTYILILREIEFKDTNDFFLIRSNQQVMASLHKIPFKNTYELRNFISFLKNQLAEGTGIRWAVCLKKFNLIIGCIGLHKIDYENKLAEIGYKLLPTFHNQGIASEAMNNVVEYAFKSLNFKVIEVGVKSENLLSIKLLTKNGFKKSRSTNGDYFFDGCYLDSDYYTLNNPYL